MLTAIINFIKGKSFPVFLWFASALIIPVVLYFQDRYNNYTIFKNVFLHTRQQLSLYAPYPADYFDLYHYGPVFSMLIAPFALMPDVIGMVGWSLLNTWLLYKAIQLLPLQDKQKYFIMLIAFIELTTSQHGLQINPAVTAWIILSYIFIMQRKDRWAALMVITGFLIKLYGIAALVFGLFSCRKALFLYYLLIITVLLFILPMFISSPGFIMQSYQDWFHSLQYKNMKNLGFVTGGAMQNISVTGMINRMFNLEVPLLAVLVPAAIFMLLPLIRVKQYAFKEFQLRYLSALLISIVLFSTSSESPTYIIAVTGAAIFFILDPFHLSRWKVGLLIFMLLLTSLSPTDLIPAPVRVFISQHSLKALPCFIIWLTIIWELLSKNFAVMQEQKGYWQEQENRVK